MRLVKVGGSLPAARSASLYEEIRLNVVTLLNLSGFDVATIYPKVIWYKVFNLLGDTRDGVCHFAFNVAT